MQISEGRRRRHSWYQSSRVIALLCSIKISAVHHLVLSQSTRVTDGRTDGQNYDSQDRPCICSRGKNGRSRYLLSRRVRFTIRFKTNVMSKNGWLMAWSHCLEVVVRRSYKSVWKTLAQFYPG